MATTIPLALGSYVSQDPRASSKRLIGCFSELLDQDTTADVKGQQPPATLRRMPGIRDIPGFNDGSGLPVRGFWEMNGIEYVVIGPNLYSVQMSPITQVALMSAPLNNTPITGFQFVRMTDNGACMVILEPGTVNCWTYTPLSGTTWNTLDAQPFFQALGAIDCWFVDTYIVFLALNGTTFFNDDGRQISGNNQITFTTAASFTREFGTDLFVGGTVDHREVMVFGRRTSEGYLNVGNPTGTPFSSAPDTFMQIGAHPLCPYAIALQDQSIFWVGNDLTVRRRNGQTPIRVSNSGIENLLQTTNLTGCYALTPTVYGHPMWILVMPQGAQTIAYDCLTQKWFNLTSSGATAFYRPQAYHNGLGVQLMGDGQSSQVGVLDATVGTEFGATQIVEITTQPVYDKDNRIQHRRLELITTMGGGSNQTVAPTASLYVSDNSGKTYEEWSDPQTLGTQGEDEGTGQRAVWWQLGQSRNRVYKFRITDATPLFTVDIQATLDGGKY
jgi:hypothetical protein